MFEKNEEIRESVLGILRSRTTLEPDDYANDEEKRRSELIKQIKNGEFEIH